MMKGIKWIVWMIACIFMIGFLMGCSQEKDLNPLEGSAVSSQSQALPTFPTESQISAPSKPIEIPQEGAWIIGIEQNNQVVLMKPGEQFELRLKEGYIWEVSIENTAVVKLVEPGDESGATQGVYQAINPGETVLRASGDPPCRWETPACMQPSLLYELKIQVVQP